MFVVLAHLRDAGSVFLLLLMRDIVVRELFIEHLILTDKNDPHSVIDQCRMFTDSPAVTDHSEVESTCTNVTYLYFT